MILHSIHDNIIIPQSSYLGVYKDEEKNRSLQRDKYVFEVGTKLKTDKTVVHVSSLKFGIKLN